MRILVAETSPDLGELLVELLQGEGWSAQSVTLAVEAAVRLSRRDVDVLLLDLDLPDLAALDLARAVADYADTAVVAMSASLHSWEPGALAAGATLCLRKPFSLTRLVDSLRAFEHGRGGGARAWPADVQLLDRGDLERLRRLAPEELDGLPFGVILLGDDRRIAAYNAFEATAAGRPAPQVLGRRLSEIAPCSQVRAFAAAIERGLQGEDVGRVLRLVFPFFGGRMLVNVRFVPDPETRLLWLLVSKGHGEPSPELLAAAQALEESLAGGSP